MKRKINIDRPEISTSEIVSRQNFSSLMHQLPKVTKPPIYKTGWFITTVASVAGIAVITSNFIANDKTSTQNSTIATEANIPSEPEIIVSSELENHETTSQFNEDVIILTSNVETSITIEEDYQSEALNNEKVGNFQDEVNQLENEMEMAKKAYQVASSNRKSFEQQVPVKPISKGNPDRQFVLDADPNDFPELSMYKNLLFEVEANDPNFSTSVYDEEWEGIKLKSKVKGQSYYLSLFRGNTSKTFSVFPIFKGDNYDVAFEFYQKELNDFNQNLEQLITEEQNLKLVYESSLDKLNKLKDQSSELSKTN